MAFFEPLVFQTLALSPAQDREEGTSMDVIARTTRARMVTVRIVRASITLPILIPVPAISQSLVFVGDEDEDTAFYLENSQDMLEEAQAWLDS